MRYTNFVRFYRKINVAICRIYRKKTYIPSLQLVPKRLARVSSDHGRSPCSAHRSTLHYMLLNKNNILLPKQLSSSLFSDIS